MENNYIGNSRTESIMCDIKPQFYNLISSLVELKSLDVFKILALSLCSVLCGYMVIPFNHLYALRFFLRKMKDSGSTGDFMVKCNGF